MNKINIEKIIADSFTTGGWVRYNKTIARVCSTDAAIILGNLIDKYSYWEQRGIKEWFHVRDHIEYETALSHHLQRKGEKELIANNLITVTPKGLPKKNYYTIDFEAIAVFLSVHYKSLKPLTYTDSPGEPIDIHQVNNNKNIGNKNIGNKNKINNMPDEEATQATPPPTGLEEPMGCYGMEDEGEEESSSDEETLHLATFMVPSASLIDRYLVAYQQQLVDYGLRKLKNIKSHIRNILEVSADKLEFMLENPTIFQMFFTYCDDKSYDMDIRRYECNSGREPSIFLNDSVYRRFIYWMENERYE
jgi:hypothetical protein